MIPKLELQATVLAVRLKYTILEEINFDIDKVKFWTNSKITLSYIRSYAQTNAPKVPNVLCVDLFSLRTSLIHSKVLFLVFYYC